MLQSVKNKVSAQYCSVAAVSLGSGGTVQGRIVAVSPDGRVTLDTPQGSVTGRPVVPETTRGQGLLATIFRL
ncbi:hypothetical protein [Paracoccus sp. MC1862]|uniref:hypothetical protein n=1 Tax=Paracoccus sp. MC1862 TaxID=2760307 RepID=UPI001603FBF2|nr:hypothetical protein [Paracoccus sp. MC1862]MBB1497236.1 hypothetical protein [Paracoccus sp. MC1862]